MTSVKIFPSVLSADFRRLGQQVEEIETAGADRRSELRDGRVLVVDSRDAMVKLVDLARGTATQVGRQGAGPREYQGPSLLQGSLAELRADSEALKAPREAP